MSYYDGGWAPYVSVGERRENARRATDKLRKKGQTITPVTIEGREIAASYWGKSWCQNLEAYSDYENRMPRGRTYVRNGSVVDLQITTGRVTALVSGSSLYKVSIEIRPLATERWKSVVAQCAGKIDSVVALLQGKLSASALAVIAHPTQGLFPAPSEIKLSCSCPDSARMCKHVAAALYGVGNRLDAQPELFFTLRKVDKLDLVAAGTGALVNKAAAASHKAVAEADLASVFGIEMDVEAGPAEAPVVMPATPVKKETPAKSAGARPAKASPEKKAPTKRLAKPAIQAVDTNQVVRKPKRPSAAPKANVDSDLAQLIQHAVTRRLVSAAPSRTIAGRTRSKKR